MLAAEGIVKRFAGVAALDGASIEVARGAIVGLVGPNGSGKSTLLNVVSGFLRPDGGRVELDGRRIEGRAPWSVSDMGLRRTFQLPLQPERMTVMEVMLCGAHLPIGARAWASVVRRRAVRAEEREAIERARHVLADLQLEGLSDHAAGKLSGGQQKLLSFGAALMGSPRLLVLDEPTAGVAPALREVLAERLRALGEDGTSILVVEHDMRFVQRVCQVVHVLDRGRTIARCTPAELASDPRVVEAYLGASPHGG